MTTIESIRKFGLKTRGFVAGILAAIGSAFTLLGLAVLIADCVFGTFGLEGPVLYGFLLIFIGGGLGFIFSGVRMFLKEKKRVDGLREAYENNRCIMADIVDVRANTSTTKTSDNMFTGVHYREFYQIECHYKDAAGRTHIYYSPSLYFNPEGMIISRQVPVYIDRDDENNFFVDIDQVLSPMEIHEG